MLTDYSIINYVNEQDSRGNLTKCFV